MDEHENMHRIYQVVYVDGAMEQFDIGRVHRLKKYSAAGLDRSISLHLEEIQHDKVADAEYLARCIAHSVPILIRDPQTGELEKIINTSLVRSISPVKVGLAMGGPKARENYIE